MAPLIVLLWGVKLVVMKHAVSERRDRRRFGYCLGVSF